VNDRYRELGDDDGFLCFIVFGTLVIFGFVKELDS
jgi:hypothetical protein